MASAATMVADDATDTADTTAAATTTAADAQTTSTDTSTDTATTTAANDDWRARMAGDDKALLGYLARVPSEKALAEQVKKYNDDLKQGKFIKPLPENSTDAEKAEYRKQTGVPDKPDDYLTGLPDGIIFGDDDKPFVDVFTEKMHAANAPKNVTAAALSAYMSIVEDQAATQAETEAQFKDAGTEMLREEWGNADFKRNLNAVTSFIGTLPEAVGTALIGGRNAAGMPLGSDPEVIKWLAGLALDANPLSTVVPGSGAGQITTLNAEIAKLENMMGDKNSEYWKGATAPANRARYLELISARDKLS